jgi:cellulose synthase operon protein YhjQ
MTDPNPQSDANGTPEDVATLYSWANLHGAKYRDFSAARAQTREKARLRAEQALEQERQQAAEQDQTQDQIQMQAAELAELHRAEEQAHAAEAAHQAELTAEWESHQAADEARRNAQRSEDLAAQQAAADLVAQHESELAAEQAKREAENEAARQAELDAAQDAERESARLAVERATRAAERQAAEEQAAAEHAARVEAEQAAQRAAQEAAERAQARELAAQQAAQREAELAKQRAAELARQRAAEQAAARAAEDAVRERNWPKPERFPSSPYTPAPASYQPAPPPSYENEGYGQPQAIHAPSASPQSREEKSMSSRTPWSTPDTQEPAQRPAWLTPERPETGRPEAGRFDTGRVEEARPETARPEMPRAEAPGQAASSSALTPTPEDTLQGSRDRLTSRWFALRGIFDGTPPMPEAAPPPIVSRAPAMAVFSLAGGVGKTSLVATLGRALSARGERVLLVDTAAFGLLPFFFGATDQRPGLLRTFSPPGVSSDAPIQMVTIDPDGLGNETPNQESLSGEISKFSRGVSRVIVDLATASGSTTRRIMRMAPLVLVPVIPDMNSVVSVSSIDAFFEHNSSSNGKPSLPFYVLNQFDGSLPLHLDVREVLREQLGERLLPFALRRTQAMSEALAEGMTVMDYAPNSSLADDFTTLASWVKNLSAPAITSYRGVRWSER